MTDTTTPITAKWWGSSLTIRGALLTAASTVLPAVAAMVGIDGEAVRQLGDQTVNVIQAVGGLIGTGLTIIGRVRASAPLTTRALNVRI